MPNKNHPVAQIVRHHVKCNVMGMVVALANDGDEDAFALLHGDPEGAELAYQAYEVLVVSEKLARCLRLKGERVARLWRLDLWARRASSLPVSRDTTIEEIVKMWPK